MKKFLFFAWQLPQHLLACLLFIIYCKTLKFYDKAGSSKVYISPKFPGGVSLGNFIFLNNAINSKRTILHEYGHSLQSQYLGPLYLLIVGLPSITMNIMSRFNREFALKYYTRFPENWADKLGNVSR